MNMNTFFVRPLGAVIIPLFLIGCGGASGNGPVVETFLETPDGAPDGSSEETPEDTKALAQAAEDDRQRAEVDKLASASLNTTEAKVAIDLYIMSQCPYGVQAVEALMDVVDKTNGEVALNIDYIGQKKPDGALSSMHGDSEVQGNIDQICGRLAAPTEAQFWSFLTCVNDKWREIPHVDEDCAREASLDMQQYNRCSSSELGKKLLASSFDRAAEVGATGSPSIFFGGEQYSGNRSSQAMLQFICSKWGDERSLQTCENMPDPPEVMLYVLNDKRCGEPCNTDRMMQSMKGIFTGLKPVLMDWSDPRTKKMMVEAGIEKLPALLFDKSVEKDAGGHKHMRRWLSEAGPYYQVKVKSDFDPKAEICDNDKDDTGNGKVDCNDATCKGTMGCRKEKQKQLEVFVMSQCPFGAMAMLAMGEVKDAFRKKDLRFNIHFVANNNDGKISSMHGQSEVDEDMRWLCAQKHFPRDYLDYVWCRAEDYRNPDWQQCAKGKIKANTIQGCMDSGEGEALLKKDIQIADKLGIRASPTWIANGRYQFSGVTPRAIQENYCRQNPDLSGCKKELSNERSTSAPAGSCGD